MPDVSGTGRGGHDHHDNVVAHVRSGHWVTLTCSQLENEGCFPRLIDKDFVYIRKASLRINFALDFIHRLLQERRDPRGGWGQCHAALHMTTCH